ncbi:MAG: hypothetical protein Q4G59_07340 [Planctomycetia bacterium]|nr:hypothetical protein [Planctomycetia bacterium]
MNRREMIAASAGVVALCMTNSTEAADKMAGFIAGDDASMKNWLLKECQMEYFHLGIPTDQDMKWDTYLENLKLHIMEYENDPFGIEWMKFDEGTPMPEIIVKRPHVAFKIANFDEAVKKFKLLVPVSSPRPGMKTCFIEHKGIGIEFVSK